MEPSKGRIVNYHCIKGEEYLGCGDDHILPAIITSVLGGDAKAVNLIVFTNQPSSLLAMRTSVAYGMTNGGGWTWPRIEKVEFMTEEGDIKVSIGNKGEVEKIAISAPTLPPPFKPTVPMPKVG